jgi:hypothetical protein
VIIATIQHSGTMKLLEMVGYSKRNGKPLEEADSGLRFTHLYDSAMPKLLSSGDDIMTTDRPYSAILKSWCTRNKDLNELDRQVANWLRLLELKPFVVQIWR